MTSPVLRLLAISPTTAATGIRVPAKVGTRYQDLGAGYYDERINKQKKARNHSASSKRSATPSPSPRPPDRLAGRGSEPASSALPRTR
jgi:hypothetical protein